MLSNYSKPGVNNYDSIEEAKVSNKSVGPDTLEPDARGLSCGRKKRNFILALVFTGGFATVATKTESGQSILANLPGHFTFQPNNASKDTFDIMVNLEQCPGYDPVAMLEPTSTVKDLDHGAVSADDERCSNIGASILRDHDGNAIDAAVATTLCLQVVNPSGSSLGGGAFILIHADAKEERNTMPFEEKRKRPYDEAKAKKVTEVVDCREIAPSGSTMNMFENDPDESWNGGKAIAVPGQLRGLELMHSRHGRLPWSTVVKPAMKLARDGIVVSPNLAHALNLKSSKAKISAHRHLQWLLTKNHDGKTLLQEGDILHNPELVETFRAIMEEGADAIYTGKRAEQIAKEIQDEGGIITKEDIEGYRPTLRDPLIAKDINGFTMVGVPPPSSGGAVVIGAARLLAGYLEPLSSFADTLSQHRIIEAMKHAYAIRMSLSDPDFYEDENEAAVRDLIEGSYMEELRKMTKDDSILPMSKYGGSKWGLLKDGDVGEGTLTVTEEGHDNRRRQLRTEDNHRDLRLFQYLEDHGTTHISIIDKWNNAVTMTTTINTYFGSGVASPSTGIIFNSQMDDFASPGRPNHYGVPPAEANYLAPGKKPLSSISPTLVFRSDVSANSSDDDDDDDDDDADLGKLMMALGASGGPKIPSAVLQVFVNYALLGMPLYEAVSRPRLHDQLLFKGHPATLYDHSVTNHGPVIEVPEHTKDALEKRGHNLFPVSNTGNSQVVAINLETNKITAVSDVRKGGRAVGY